MEMVEEKWKKTDNNKISEKGSVPQILSNNKIHDLI